MAALCRLYHGGMKFKVIAILESRTGERLAELLERRGATALRAPALEEVPDVDLAELQSLLTAWRARPFELAIFQTGVGTRALFAALDGLNATGEFMSWLARARVVVRGPKPTAELNARGVRIDIKAASPFTSETVIAALSGVALTGTMALVQRYGAANPKLCEALKARGASVVEMATYRWALPTDTSPLCRLLDALKARRVDAVVFTSAVQVHNLKQVADARGEGDAMSDWLRVPLIASIGPVCSQALAHYGLKAGVEADPPKLGPLLDALERALQPLP
jgi:uroporphyrinogen-III synthase